MKCIFLYNSLDKKIIRNYDYIVKELSSMFTIDSFACNSLNELIDTIKNECAKYDVLLFSGGDGTFSYIVNEVYRINSEMRLAYIPSGTACDIAKNLGISKNVKKAISIIKEDTITKHDIGVINDRYFMYVIGVGTFTKVSYKASKYLKKVLGVNAYAINGLNELLRPIVIDAKIKIDEKEIRCFSPLILVMNSKSIGGVKINKLGHRDDGTLDVIIVKKAISNILSISRLIINHIKKNKKHKSYYDIYQGKDIEISLDKEYKWNIDGEEGIKGDAKVSIKKGVLNIYTKR